MLPGRRAQVWRHQPSFRRPRHFHDEPEVNLVVRGWAKLGVGARELPLGPGQLVLLEPGVDHELLAASDDLELYVVAVRPELAAREPQLFGGKTEPTSLRPGVLERTADALHQLGQAGAAEAVERGLVELWTDFVAAAPSAQGLARRASQTLRAERALSGTELARRLKTTPSEISRAFRSGLGLPMVEYRARLRLLEFVRRVDAGQSLTAAALDADFGSYAQCFRVFERALGCPPRAYFRGARREIDERVVIRVGRTISL
jgi:AraC-like DNA-binding protein/mannose-6-phosphate isomerase-like protein (cupin superfamily)